MAWGTYDLGKPRVRILLRGLRDNGVSVRECHRPIWTGVEDKSQVHKWDQRVRIVARWIAAYPALLWCFLRSPRQNIVLVPYLGQLDILVLWPLAKLRGSRLVLDAFLSLYNTVVEDRQLIGRRNPIAWATYACEWLACHAADQILVDTHAHGAYFCQTFGLDPSRVHRVLVGVEPEHFPAAPARVKPAGEALRVLFYGQFIPLHGVDTIVRAAKLTEQARIHWHLIGTGQEAAKIQALIAQLKPANLEWSQWVPYPELIREIHSADLCLGIFGSTDKAARVIPNKVFQVLATGKPIITRDGPAARELVAEAPQVTLVAPADPTALAAAVTKAAAAQSLPPRPQAFLPAQVLRPLLAVLHRYAALPITHRSKNG
jgi:glycosyltransferase involved in cell wall biosynthesis